MIINIFNLTSMNLATVRPTRKSFRYVAEGFETDVNNLLKQFEDSGSIRFETFGFLWKSMNFDGIFLYREIREIGLFIDQILMTLLKRLSTEESFHVKAGLLYILYGVYFRQPLDHKIKIRMTIDLFNELVTIVETAKCDSHYDICYIFWSLFHNNAFLFVARVEMSKIIEETETNTMERRSLLDQYISEEQVDHLSLLHDKYLSLKNVQESSEVRSLAVADTNFITMFKRKLGDLKRKIDNPDYVPADETEDSSHLTQLNIRRAIKSRVFNTQQSTPVVD